MYSTGQTTYDVQDCYAVEARDWPFSRLLHLLHSLAFSLSPLSLSLSLTLSHSLCLTLTEFISLSLPRAPNFYPPRRIPRRKIYVASRQPADGYEASAPRHASSRREFLSGYYAGRACTRPCPSRRECSARCSRARFWRVCGIEGAASTIIRRNGDFRACRVIEFIALFGVGTAGSSYDWPETMKMNVMSLYVGNS